MNTLLNQFGRFITKHRLFEPHDKLLLAVSGGMDSVVLSDLLQVSGYDISLAHCNFQLRGNESNLDAALVASLAQKHDLVYHEKAFDTQSYARDLKLSIQQAARALRYQWFNELMQSHNIDFLLTAHHANDQVETMLYHLTKGAGIAGLRGIPLMNDRIRRPLLFAKREDIETYAHSNKLEWREDASNQEDKYSRNRIRLHVIPELKKINPGLEHTMLNNSQRYDALEKLLQGEVQSIKEDNLISHGDRFSLQMPWYNESKGGLAVLTEILRAFKLNADQCFSIGAAFQTKDSSTVGKQFFSSHYRLTIDRNTIEIEPKKAAEVIDCSINSADVMISTAIADFTFDYTSDTKNWSNDKYSASLDADLVAFPLTIRNWVDGDAFQPLGMKGKKKLSDFMIDEKIPVNLKSRVLLFESQGDIIWVAGHRIDDRYKITPNTKRVLIIKMTDHV